MRSLLLMSWLLICSTSTPAEEPPARFAGTLRPGQEVWLLEDAQRDQVALRVLSRPRRISENTPQAQGALYRVEAVRDDYVLLENETLQIALPYASVRLIAIAGDPLETRVTGHFNRTPLQEFVRQLSQQTDVDIRLDAEALKIQGYTRNMAQEVQAKDTPARQLLTDLLNRLPGLVITVHEDHYRLTSRAAAEQEQATVLPLIPPRQP